MITLSSRASWPRVSAIVGALVFTLGQPLWAQQLVPTRGQSGQITPVPQRPTVQLTMDQAVAMALEHNLGLKNARISLPIADQGIAGARANFLPQLRASFNRQASLNPPSSSFQGTADITALTLSSSTTVSQSLPWYGGDYSATWGTRRGTSTDPTSSFNPSLGSSLTLNFNQPLWRDFKIDGLRAGLETSELNRSIADLNLESRVITLEVSVRNAYLNLVASIEGLKVANQNVDTAETALKAARSRVDVGIAPQIDIVAQEVNVSRNKASQLRAQIDIQTAEDALRELILDPARPDYWTASLEPTESVDVKEREVNVDDAIATALKNRIDLRVARRNLEITDFNLRVAKNSTLPDLSVGLSYTASGSAGSRLTFEDGVFPPVIVARTDTSFLSALGDAFLANYPTWSVGATFTYPLGRNSAVANYTRSQLQRQQEELALKEAELGVVADVRLAARNVQNSYQLVLVNKQALDSTTRQLEAEERKFGVGLSSTLDLQNVQNQLTQARTSELQSRIAYLRALIQYDTVQKTR